MNLLCDIIETGKQLINLEDNQMWVTLPFVPGVGVHQVLLPKNFKKSLADFATIKDFLKAVRDEHARDHASR
ncbi:MAG: hypothetical protein KBD06_03220 [Candidatus Pacebacteria bacterium]|nr:hypothetical protein [Candidatus Paceibacterota bacterium]